MVDQKNSKNMLIQTLIKKREPGRWAGGSVAEIFAFVEKS